MPFQLLIFLVISLSFSYEHAIYVSVTELTVRDGSDGQLVVKVFRDDLIDVLRLANANQSQSTMDSLDDQGVTDYFNTHIQFFPDPAKDLILESYTIEGDSFFIRFKVRRSMKSVEACTLSHLFELFPNQKNILKVDLGHQSLYKTFKVKNQIESIR